MTWWIVLRLRASLRVLVASQPMWSLKQQSQFEQRMAAVQSQWAPRLPRGMGSRGDVPWVAHSWRCGVRGEWKKKRTGAMERQEGEGATDVCAVHTTDGQKKK
jgi:hypothetical protein